MRNLAKVVDMDLLSCIRDLERVGISPISTKKEAHVNGILLRPKGA